MNARVKSFLKLITLAFIIAAPVVWYLMTHWLEDYAYRIHISWWVFVFTGISVLLVALLTLSFQAIKTAMLNPVEALRTE